MISFPDYKPESKHPPVLVLEGLSLVISLDCELPTLQLSADIPILFRGWSGGAMVLGKLPVPGRSAIWIQ